MIEFIESGDIFKIEGVDSYAHGCNCAGAMGRGIAVRFRDMFPEMYEEYKRLCSNGLFNPGDVFDYDYGKGHVYNLGTQKTWRTNAKLEYIDASMRNMLEAAHKHKVTKIAMPAIGAGLGGLLWSDVRSLMKEIGEGETEVTLFVVETFKPV